ncbi:putative tripartite motif-containing protein 64B isoform X2 [Parambassis ranga]|uniref:Tripartite motif-containing protein 64B isoform X2 n=1 Tax=Parambassis ranga TaxID=210632 RepID=A0A6P7I0T2_9TELE|nr:putative tripartite motif-containing protein 64B isoform X2 [Parambassis ranga]
MSGVRAEVRIAQIFNMSLQVCHCGWSSVTTYHGLRIHQGMNGCTERGMRIPESEQFTYQTNYWGSSLMMEEPYFNPFSRPLKTDSSSDVSLQVCHCGWSSVTTYQGLRTHQGKMGCTAKGVRVSESKQVRPFTQTTKTAPAIKLEKPSPNISKPSVKTGEYAAVSCTPKEIRVPESQQVRPFTQTTNTAPAIKLEKPSLVISKPSAKADLSSDVSRQVCHCGWSSITTYQGLRTHQGKMGCTAKGVRIPQSEQATLKLEKPSLDMSGPSVKTDSSSDVSRQVCHCGWSSMTTYQGLRTHQGKMGCTPKGVRIPESEKATIKMEKPSLNMSRPSVKTGEYAAASCTPKGMRVSRLRASDQNGNKPTFNEETITPQSNPPSTGTTVEEDDQSLFQTPPRPRQTASSSDKARRVLDFTGAQQEEEEKEEEEEGEEENEAQKLLTPKQDRMKAELQQKINTREHKVVDVRSSVKTCKGSLDAEWLEINSVFSEVMKAVEDARLKALGPLEQRRQEVKKEAKDLIQKLHKEIDTIKTTIDELDKNPDLQVPPVADLSVDTSFSFGTLQPTTSTMMKEINKKLEKLSSLELKRTPAFAVDVKLDPQTAHPCLLVSDDGKEVRDSGLNPEHPDTPERFNEFACVLGCNRLTSGKSYWEVEVSNKTGWDLGVARHNANRKGDLKLNPDYGYWVTVHCEGENYTALTAPPTSLSLKKKPQKVGVFVDYEEGLVSFYDVTTKSHIYSFTECRFGGEIAPFFSPHLKENEKNAAPLIICAVQTQQ